MKHQAHQLAKTIQEKEYLIIKLREAIQQVKQP